MLRETIDQVLKTNSNASKASPPGAVEPRAALGQCRPSRVTMGSGGNGSRAGGVLAVTISGTGGRGPPWKNRSTASWPRSTPTRTAASEFILADAKDADMAFGIGAPGRSPEAHAGEVRYRTLEEYRDRSRRSSSRGWSTSC